MSVLAHPEEDQIKNRPASRVPRRDFQQFLLSAGSGTLRWILAANAVDLLFQDIQRREHQLLSDAIVAFRIGRRNTTLIGPKEMYRVEQVSFAFAQSCRGRKKCSRDPSARKGDQEWFS